MRLDVLKALQDFEEMCESIPTAFEDDFTQGVIDILCMSNGVIRNTKELQDGVELAADELENLEDLIGELTLAQQYNNCRDSILKKTQGATAARLKLNELMQKMKYGA